MELGPGKPWKCFVVKVAIEHKHKEAVIEYVSCHDGA